jgi:hypothetical protein
VPSPKFARLPANSESSAAISPLLVNRGGLVPRPESKKAGDAGPLHLLLPLLPLPHL